jgi:hypothetical protein
VSFPDRVLFSFQQKSLFIFNKKSLSFSSVAGFDCCFRPNQRFCLTPFSLSLRQLGLRHMHVFLIDFMALPLSFLGQYFLLLGGSAVLFPICFFPLPPVWRPTLWYPEGCSWFRSCWYLRFLWEHDMPRRHAMLRPGSRARRGALRRHPTLSPARAYTCSLMSSL